MQKRREHGGIHAEVTEKFRKGIIYSTMLLVSYIRARNGAMKFVCLYLCDLAPFREIDFIDRRFI
jgi:hypothetical protein